MISLLIILCHLLGIFSAFHSVMSTRTSQGAIAWVVSLITFPYLAVPAYWILGRSRFNGYVKAHQASDHSIEIDKMLLQKELAPFRIPSSEVTPAAKAAEKMANMPYLKGNHVDLLID